MHKKIRKQIHKLRQQPVEVRKQIAFISTLACAIILFLLWAYGLGQTIFAKTSDKSTEKDLQPFTVLKDNLVDGYKSVSQ